MKESKGRCGRRDGRRSRKKYLAGIWKGRNETRCIGCASSHNGLYLLFFIFFSSAEHSFIFSRTLSSKLLIDSGNTSQVKHRGMYRRSDERHLSLSGVPCAGVQSLCKCMGLQVSHPLQCRLDSMDVLVKDHIEPGSQWTEHHSSG